MVFPVVIYGCECWTIKKVECWRDAFELWCWRRLLRVPWTARSNQSILKKSVLNIHWKNWCWSWNSNTLATWWEELIIGKDPNSGKDWRQEEKGMIEDEMVGWHHWQWTWVWASSGNWVMDKEAWPAAVHEVAKSGMWLRDWTELNYWIAQLKILLVFSAYIEME